MFAQKKKCNVAFQKKTKKLMIDKCDFIVFISMVEGCKGVVIALLLQNYILW